MSHENAALVMNQFVEIFEGTGLEPTVWDPEQDRHHLRPPGAGGDGQDGHQPEEDPRVRGRAGHHQVPRHPRRRGRHLPPDPGGERLRAARHGGGGHRQPHQQPRRAWAPSPSASAPPTWPACGRWADGERGGAAHHQGGGGRRVQAVRGAEGPHPVPHRDDLGRGRQLPGASSSTGGPSATCPSRGGFVLCNMSVEAGATCGIVPADEETVRYLREEACAPGPFDGGAAGRGRRLREGHRDRRDPAGAAGGPAAHRGQRGARWARWRAPGSTRSSSARAPTGAWTTWRWPRRSCAARSCPPDTRMLVFPASWRIWAEAHAPGLPERPGRGRRRDHEPGLRLLPGRAPGRAGRRRSGARHHQPQLQGPHGQPQRVGLPGVAR